MLTDLSILKAASPIAMAHEAPECRICDSFFIFCDLLYTVTLYGFFRRL
jgi:hypothetical protein